jgi:hypothetical protein
MTIKSGFKQDVKGSWIPKDPEAQLVYSLDWATEYLPQGASIVQVEHDISPVTDPALDIVTEGIQQGVTYVELRSGLAGTIYTVEVTVTLDSGAVDTRRFRIKCEDRFL